jgi:hypothetical protein
VKPLNRQKEDLLKRKLEVDARIGSISLELARASAQYHETGRGMSRERYFKLQSELISLRPESQRLQMELGRLSGAIRRGEAKSLGEHFIAIARMELATDQFERILRLAVELRDGEKL